MINANTTAVLPHLDALRGAPRTSILDCLNLIERLGQQGIRPPDGYLFALSQEIVRPHAESEVR